MNPQDTPPATETKPKAKKWSTWLPVAAFSILWLDLIRQLSYQWSTNDQYAYGWFVPFFAAALLWRRWQDRPGTGPQDPPQVSAFISHPSESGLRFQVPSLLPGFLLSTFCVLLLLLLLPLRVIHEINQDWPLITWPYTLIVVALTLYAFHLAGLPPSSHKNFSFQLPASSFSPWVKHFFFPVAFILVAVRWPYRIEHALTQNLMQTVASLTVEILGWLNIPALQRGNLIEISTGVLGVDEACSGIRSFQSTLMAGLLMGEFYRLRLLPRTALVIIGLSLAFVFNVVRTFILTWQAEKQGMSAIDKWHDPAGFTITIACFICLWALALLASKRWSSVEKAESRKQKAETPPPAPSAPAVQASGFIPHPSSLSVPRPTASPTPGSAHQVSAFSLPPSALAAEPPPSARPSSQFLLSAFPISAFALPAFCFPTWRRYLVAVGLWSLFCIVATEAWYRSHQIHRADTVQWWVSYPTNLPSFEPVTVTEFAAKLLRHNAESGGSWTEPDGTKWSVFCFRWKEGDPTARMSAQGHRPEYCLVGSGHTMLSMSDIRYIPAHGLKLPFRLYNFESGGRPLHVFFCLWEDGAEKQAGFAKTKYHARLRAALDGRRGMGQQTLELILSGYDSLETAEQAVRQRLPEIITTGNQCPNLDL